ncbi:MAG: peptidoglycan DD-metalloendopeptidase family protein [Chloroflexi bacterium]|nr:peptidoglycan DD-metalloendopeptidase family protein [Chloroflexota bacterium]
MGGGADDLGLIYMNARFYLPALGRFASADTIVPNPTNPQSLNRYSYVRNSPLNLIDPTGHRECGASDDCSDPLPSPSGQKIKQHLVEQEFLETIQKPADQHFGGFGGQRTVNCTGNCNESIHPGRDTDLTNDSNRGDSIFATADGRVASVGYMASTWDEDNQRWRAAFGYYVVIGHEVGDETLYSIYAHLEPDSINVSVGKTVKQGDIIAGMGELCCTKNRAFALWKCDAILPLISARIYLFIPSLVIQVGIIFPKQSRNPTKILY